MGDGGEPRSDGGDAPSGPDGTAPGVDGAPEESDGADVVLSLPASLRGELKDPLGPVYTDADELLAGAGRPLITVGDIVTYHLLTSGTRPTIALVDGKTKREAVTDEVHEAIDTGSFDRHVTVRNPAATLTAGLLAALRAAIDRATAGEGQSTVIEVVEGEEDLAALPALAIAPEDAGVVYGQPDEGMVLATADDETRAGVWDLLERMDGDAERARELLGE